jgi:hypothetical protein
MNWAVENDALQCALGQLNIHFPECHVYGEWLVPHSLKTYKECSWRRFYIFDVVKSCGDHVHYDEYSPILMKYELDFIAPMKIIQNPQEENLYRCLEENKYLIEDGKGNGEGIVVKNYGFTNKYGRRTWAKIVTSEFKDKHVKEMGAPKSSGTDYIEEKIVDKYVTSTLIDKVYAKINNEMDGWSSKYIARLLQTVFYDLVREHTWDYVKENKMPKIDYKVLNRFCTMKIKELKPEVF